MYIKNMRSTIKKGFFQSNTSVSVIFFAIILTLGLGFFLRPLFREHSASAVKSSMPQSPVVNSEDAMSLIETNVNTHAFAENNIIDNAPNIGTQSDVQIQEVSGISLLAANFRVLQNQLMIDTCFDKPDGGDWIIRHASLRLGDKDIEYSGSILMEFPITGTSEKEQRCDTIYFEGLSPETDFSNALFIVDWILAFPREGEMCSPEYLAKFQKALDQANKEITVECYREALENGGIAGIRVASKPDSMSQEEAESIIYNHNFFLSVNGIRGPWLFPISLEQ